MHALLFRTILNIGKIIALSACLHDRLSRLPVFVYSFNAVL